MLFLNLTLSFQYAQTPSQHLVPSLTKNKGMQIPFNTLTGRFYLYKHTYLRTDYPNLLEIPSSSGNIQAHVSPTKALEGSGNCKTEV